MKKQVAILLQSRKGRGKYGNTKATYDGLTFDSKKEMERYIVLKDAETRGVISDLRTQVTYELIPDIREEYVEHLKTKDKIKTRCVQKGIFYRADFVYTKGDTEVIEDVKISPTMIPHEFHIKAKLFFWRYGKKIRLVYKAKEEV